MAHCDKAELCASPGEHNPYPGTSVFLPALCPAFLHVWSAETSQQRLSTSDGGWRSGLAKGRQNLTSTATSPTSDVSCP